MTQPNADQSIIEAVRKGVLAELEHTPKLNTALAKLQAELPVVASNDQRLVEVEHKDGTSHSYNYGTLATVIKIAQESMGKYGLSFTALPTLADPGDGKIGMFLKYSLRHESGEQIGGLFPLSRDGGIQALGSWVTYGRRYCFQAALNIAAEQDDNGQAAQDAEQGGSVRKARPATATARTNRPRRSGPPDAGAAADLPGGDPAEGREEVPRGMLDHMFGLFGKLGITDRAQRLAAVSVTVGREITTSSQLTREEVKAVSEQAQARVDAQALNPPTDGPTASDRELVDGPTDNTAPEES